MRYLVTGGAGFIGSHIARALLAQGHEVWIVDNLLTGKKANVPEGCSFIEADIASPGLAEALPGKHFDAVFHLAAQSSGEISHEKPSYDLLTNTFGTLQLLNWCLAQDIKRFLYASSMAVYGLTEQFPVKEDMNVVPHSFYGINKLASEHYVKHFQTKGVQTTVFRMFNVYGPGQNLENMKQGMVSIYLAFVLSGQKLLVRGSKDRFRDFIYVDDVVSGWLSALNQPCSWGKTYNLASGRPTRVWELIDHLLTAFGHAPGDYPVEYGEPTPGDQFGIYADITGICADLGWQPRVDIPQGLRQMVDWAKGVS